MKRLGPALLLVVTAAAAVAVEPQTRHLGRYLDYESGRGAGVILGGDGVLTLGPVLTPLAQVEAQRLWALAADGAAVWLGTGDEGRLYRWYNGDARLLFDSPEVGIQALAADGGGSVYAGTAPDGIVYRVGADGGVATVAHTGSRYVWALAPAGQGRVLAATGVPARVLRLGAGADPEVLLEAEGDGHVRCLLPIGDGWLAGTAVAGDPGAPGAAPRRGRIYLLRDGGARLLVETEYEEVSGLAARGDTFFAAVSTAPAGDGAPEPRAALLRFDAAGVSYPVWQGVGVWAGLVDAGGGGLTGVLREPGRVLRWTGPDLAGSRVAHVDSLVPNAVLARGDDLLIGDGRGGRLWRLAPAAADSGWFDVPVQDLGAVAHWGAVDWEAEGPTQVRLRTRSGQAATPDPTWSPWSALIAAPGTPIASPPARYLQVRVLLRRGDDVPRLRRLSFTARQANLPPRIDDLTTFAYRGNALAQGPPPPATNGAAEGQRRLPQSKSLRLVRWQASDANGDALRYHIDLRGEGQTRWQRVESDLDATSVYWDTQMMPEGMTQLRLVASDAQDNPPDQALEAEWITEPFAVDNSPPEVHLQAQRRDGALVVDVELTDRVTRVRGARLSIDYDTVGRRLAAVDGLFDSRQERAQVRLADLPPGEHVLAVQAWDELDNVGVGRLLVTVED